MDGGAPAAVVFEGCQDLIYAAVAGGSAAAAARGSAAAVVRLLQWLEILLLQWLEVLLLKLSLKVAKI